jgi:ubiquinone/menaquinone biosynthesis C-methylase UbiE
LTNRAAIGATNAGELGAGEEGASESFAIGWVLLYLLRIHALDTVDETGIAGNQYSIVTRSVESASSEAADAAAGAPRRPLGGTIPDARHPMKQPVHASAFDDLADGYDASFTDTAVGRALRALVWSRLGTIFQPGQRILELGCGTGEDAVWLARRGIDVLATDLSPRMIAVAREKARRHGCSARIEFQCAAMEDVPALLEGQTLDGAFSNFGALNCISDLASLLAAVSRRLAVGAPLIAVIMGRHVPWEWMWYLSRGELSKSLRRLSREGITWRGMRISYPTPRETATMLRPHFSITRVSPLGCVLPPSYAAGWLDRAPTALDILTRLELLALRCAPLASLSDHYIIEAKRGAIASH